MSCEFRRRLANISLLSKKATRELIDSLPPGDGDREIEFVAVVRKDAEIDYLIPQDQNLANNNKLVQVDTRNGECIFYEISLEDGCYSEENFIAAQIQGCLEGSCETERVRNVINNNVVKSTNAVAFSIFENSGCGCSGGGCVYR